MSHYLPIAFDWHGLKTQLIKFGYQHCKIDAIGAHTDFDWDALTDEVISHLECLHESGEPLTYMFDPLWSEDGAPKTFVPDDDVWSLMRWEVWFFRLPEEARKRIEDFYPMWEGAFAKFDEALRAAAALSRKGYYEISICELSEDGTTKSTLEQDRWMQYCWHPVGVQA